MRIGLFGIIWLIIGLLVASSHQYLVDLRSPENIISAILAIVLWPLVLFGANLHIGLNPHLGQLGWAGRPHQMGLGESNTFFD